MLMFLICDVEININIYFLNLVLELYDGKFEF